MHCIVAAKEQARKGASPRKLWSATFARQLPPLWRHWANTGEKATQVFWKKQRSSAHVAASHLHTAKTTRSTWPCTSRVGGDSVVTFALESSSFWETSDSTNLCLTLTRWVVSPAPLAARSSPAHLVWRGIFSVTGHLDWNSNAQDAPWSSQGWTIWGDMKSRFTWLANLCLWWKAATRMGTEATTLNWALITTWPPTSLRFLESWATMRRKLITWSKNPEALLQRRLVSRQPPPRLPHPPAPLPPTIQCPTRKKAPTRRGPRHPRLQVPHPPLLQSASGPSSFLLRLQHPPRPLWNQSLRVKFAGPRESHSGTTQILKGTWGTCTDRLS